MFMGQNLGLWLVIEILFFFFSNVINNCRPKSVWSDIRLVLMDTYPLIWSVLIYKYVSTNALEEKLSLYETVCLVLCWQPHMSQGSLGLFSWRILTKKKQSSWNFKFVGEKKFCSINNWLRWFGWNLWDPSSSNFMHIQTIAFLFSFCLQPQIGNIQKVSPNSQVYLQTPAQYNWLLSILRKQTTDLYMCMDFILFFW